MDRKQLGSSSQGDPYSAYQGTLAPSQGSAALSPRLVTQRGWGPASHGVIRSQADEREATGSLSKKRTHHGAGQGPVTLAAQVSTPNRAVAPSALGAWGSSSPRRDAPFSVELPL